ncbi:AAA family ATPase [Mycolicibacterium grossiae]|uniref:AAA family ATPase n=1 Tax=Mycolicibacterium grossiae TaxID=1552759 RepID=A0A1E8PXZ8_9MYCO|nr:MobF family relaxase [Mycolicibacterium grossiae]OFJ51183.1 AAA family ATPase [Mycolicibacterium grossiae]
MLTVAKLSLWSVNYYNDTARAVGEAASNAGGGLAEYYAERDTRTPVWTCVGDARAAAELVGLSDSERSGGDADPDVVARWLDAGVAPSGECGRAHGKGGVHGFDLTFCAPKSVSLVRAFGDDVIDKAVSAAHQTAIGEALEYLAAHAGYTRVHNPVTGFKDLQKLPGLVAAAYQHETSRAGDPHLHTHVLVPNRQARGDGRLVSIDGTSLFHEARAAGIIYQATLRQELHRLVGVEWGPVDPSTGMAEIAGIAPKLIAAWSQRSTQLRQWAANNLTVVDPAIGGVTQPQLAAAQKATRPRKPESLSWAELRAGWRADERGFSVSREAQTEARRARERAAARAAARVERTGVVIDRRAVAAMAARTDKAALTRADLVEVIGAQLPLPTDGGATVAGGGDPSAGGGVRTPREVIEACVDAVGMRLSGPRLAHQREGSERFTVDLILAEEKAVLDVVDATEIRAVAWVRPEHTAAALGLSDQQHQVVTAIATSPQLVMPLSAPAGAGKTASMRALRTIVERRSKARVIVLAPTGKAVDVAVAEGAATVGYTLDSALPKLADGTLALSPFDVVIVDEAGMVGTHHWRQLLAHTTAAGAKTVMVGDPHQLAPVKARGGMFAQLCEELPWAHRLTEVWRMRDADERTASLALRDGGPAPVRRAIGWYRDHDRLHAGDSIAMAADALEAYREDVAAGTDALLIADTLEMCDALNRRIHDDHLTEGAPTVTAARGHRIATGDVIITRRNDPTVEVFDAHDVKKRLEHKAPVRNGQRWQVIRVDDTADSPRLAARRLGDGARAVFAEDYLREHVHLGHAVSVHSAQGVTSQATHAVIADTATRNLAYVALTRGRDTNHAYLYQRTVGEADHQHATPEQGVHVAQRGTPAQAAHLLRTVIGREERARTAHQTAADTPAELLPQRVASLVAKHQQTVARRWTTHRRTERRTRDRAIDHQLSRHHTHDRTRDQGYDLGL